MKKLIAASLGTLLLFAGCSESPAVETASQYTCNTSYGGAESSFVFKAPDKDSDITELVSSMTLPADFLGVESIDSEIQADQGELRSALAEQIGVPESDVALTVSSNQIDVVITLKDTETIREYLGLDDDASMTLEEVKQEVEDQGLGTCE